MHPGGFVAPLRDALGRTVEGSFSRCARRSACSWAGGEPSGDVWADAVTLSR